MSDERLPPREYVVQSIESFLTDPPDSDFHRGFLSAMLIVYTDSLGAPKDDPLVVAAEAVMA
ncbi:MAG: hypothetical protein EOO77_24880 [Oxalobacteraceae bacterium]|nr:MAG: hypothetical protein EOO77_24880 [Oxalobacteraceae bacterium]